MTYNYNLIDKTINLIALKLLIVTFGSQLWIYENNYKHSQTKKIVFLK